MKDTIQHLYLLSRVKVQGLSQEALYTFKKNHIFLGKIKVTDNIVCGGTASSGLR